MIFLIYILSFIFPQMLPNNWVFTMFFDYYLRIHFTDFLCSPPLPFLVNYFNSQDICVKKYVWAIFSLLALFITMARTIMIAHMFHFRMCICSSDFWLTIDFFVFITLIVFFFSLLCVIRKAFVYVNYLTFFPNQLCFIFIYRTTVIYHHSGA